MQRNRGGGRVGGSAIANGRGHGGCRRDKGGRGRGGSRDRDGGQTPDESSARKVLAFGLSLVGFGDGRQTCSEDL